MTVQASVPGAPISLCGLFRVALMPLNASPEAVAARNCARLSIPAVRAIRAPFIGKGLSHPLPRRIPSSVSYNYLLTWLAFSNGSFAFGNTGPQETFQNPSSSLRGVLPRQ